MLIEQCQLADYDLTLEQTLAQAKSVREDRAEKESLFKTLLNCSQGLSTATSNLDNVSVSCMYIMHMIQCVCNNVTCYM